MGKPIPECVIHPVAGHRGGATAIVSLVRRNFNRVGTGQPVLVVSLQI
jgi:hypothetical protein